MKSFLYPLPTGNEKYILVSVKDDTILEVVAKSKKDACNKLGVKSHHYHVLAHTPITVETLFHTKMTNAEVIKILSQKDPNAPCEIMCDFSTDHQSREYGLIEPEDGMCYDTSKGVLFFSEGECW